MRALNIITLASVVASSVVMLVKTFIVSKFFFFDATSHVITALVGMFLIISECALFRRYFKRNWPLLSSDHGFVSLGFAMTVLGLNMLGNMNKEATSQESLGLPFWRLLVASGILAIVIGFFNIVASFVFRDTSLNVTARQIRSHGKVALTRAENRELDSKALSIATHMTGSSSLHKTTPTITSTTPRIDMSTEDPPLATPTKEESRFSRFTWGSPIRGAFNSARKSVLPSYHTHTHSRSSSTYSRSISGESRRWNKKNRDSDVPAMPLQISGPLNTNQQFSYLNRPNPAHHPSIKRGEPKNEESLKEFKF
ncbi:hypothetical protein B0J11DRAFT_435049 [Dendryphion nanum]|uniref:DUF7598 domain-containing protein n=1 Tax=Dendryphion nanum TaxID=256645 RepID=A0A9P9DV50_9PLEO|nr:hypothetical protein B0J11DRAFT_435049 [Dendryphion nanum]